MFPLLSSQFSGNCSHWSQRTNIFFAALPFAAAAVPAISANATAPAKAHLLVDEVFTSLHRQGVGCRAEASEGSFAAKKLEHLKEADSLAAA